MFRSEPTLKNPDFTCPFILYRDASDVALGAVLCQGKVSTENIVGGNKSQPIGYLSKSLSQTQQRYSVVEKEALAVVKALEHFRPFVFGFHVDLYCDQAPLTWLFSQNSVNTFVITISTLFPTEYFFHYSFHFCHY